MNAKTVNYILIIFTLLIIPGIVITIVQNYPVDVFTLIGVAIIFPSLALLIVARYQLGGSFAFSPQAKELITHGLYSKIRHPVYFFAQVMLLGIILCLKSRPFFFAWMMIVLLQILRAKREERVLEEKFGDAYREYKRQTWF